MRIGSHGIVGIDLQRGSEMGLGFFRLVEFQQYSPIPVVRLEIIRLEAQRILELRLRFGPVLQFVKRQPQIKVRFDIFGLKSHRGLKVAERLFHLPKWAEHFA